MSDLPPDPSFEAPTGDGPFGPPRSSPRSGVSAVPEIRTIGPYRVLSLLGEGGFGYVYLAERREPMVQRVAIKVLKPGMDSRSILARFEQERQALAVMDHPNIARVLDAGETERGLPYFVMEHVAGEPINRFCDRRRLGLKDRLGLFLHVCEAVQHAHQKGIIHRDLKPSNVLVSAFDAAEDQRDGAPRSGSARGAVVKVIDFGVAKAITQAMTARTLVTEQGQLIGTPEYMSPEQASGDPFDVDTRADVYSLGVMLYELLAGVLPFDVDRFRHGGVRPTQAGREPPRPSTRLSSLDPKESAAIASSRECRPEDLGRTLRRELEWIPLMAIREDRARRYATPLDLANDIRRYLDGRALVAGPESASYRASKFVRRNRGAVAASGAMIVLLAGGMIGTGLGLLEARRGRAEAEGARAEEALQRQDAVLQRNEAQAQREAAQQAAARAEREHEKAEQSARFMRDMLSGVKTEVALGRDTTILREILDRTAARIEAGELKDNPESEIEIRLTIGSAYIDINNIRAAGPILQDAESLARATFPGDHPLKARAITAFGTALGWIGQPAAAQARHEEALAMCRRVHPADHPDILRVLRELGTVTTQLRRNTDALGLFQEAHDMARRLYPGDHPAVALALSDLVSSLSDSGRGDEAERANFEAVEMYRRLYPDGHPDLARALNNLGSFWRGRDEPERAEPVLIESVEMWERLAPNGSIGTGGALANLGSVQTALRRFDEGYHTLLRARAMFERTGQGDQPATALVENNLANNRAQVGRIDRVERHQARALAIWRSYFNGDHPRVVSAIMELARTRLTLRRPIAALVGVEEGYAMIVRLRGEEHRDTINAHGQLADVYGALGLWDAATFHADRCADLARRLLPESDPIRAQCIQMPEWALRKQGFSPLSEDTDL